MACKPARILPRPGSHQACAPGPRLRGGAAFEISKGRARGRGRGRGNPDFRAAPARAPRARAGRGRGRGGSLPGRLRPTPTPPPGKRGLGLCDDPPSPPTKPRSVGASRQAGLLSSSRRLSLFIIGSHSLVGYLYYLATDLPGLRPPGPQTRKTMRNWGWEVARRQLARGGSPTPAGGGVGGGRRARHSISMKVEKKRPGRTPLSHPLIREPVCDKSLGTQGLPPWACGGGGGGTHTTPGLQKNLQSP